MISLSDTKKDPFEPIDVQSLESFERGGASVSARESYGAGRATWIQDYRAEGEADENALGELYRKKEYQPEQLAGHAAPAFVRLRHTARAGAHQVP